MAPAIPDEGWWQDADAQWVVPDAQRLLAGSPIVSGDPASVSLVDVWLGGPTPFSGEDDNIRPVLLSSGLPRVQHYMEKLSARLGRKTQERL